MFSGCGQINMNSSMGNEIYEICKRESIRNIVEVGTWNGEGSTVCIMNGILSKKTDSVLYSIEANKDQYSRACNFWSEKQTFNKLHLLNGVLHREYASEEEIKNSCNGIIPCINEHYIPEKEMLISNNIIDINNFNNIDVIILDGGEYTTQGDFKKLMILNPKIIILDDVCVFKCKKIRDHLLNNLRWNVYKEDLLDRHGWSIFTNIEYKEL